MLLIYSPADILILLQPWKFWQLVIVPHNPFIQAQFVQNQLHWSAVMKIVTELIYNYHAVMVDNL
jgi:hypothetical protein